MAMEVGKHDFDGNWCPGRSWCSDVLGAGNLLGWYLRVVAKIERRGL